MEVSLIFLASTAKPIDDRLQNLVDEIEAQTPALSVLAARQFRYGLRQTPVEITIKEPRPFNVLEEFIIRAGIELEPAPTAEELASVLGLDPIFVRSTIKILQDLQTLAAKSPITVTTEGRAFYEKGSVQKPPYSKQIYAISDPLGEKLTFQTDPLNDVILNQPDLASYVNLDHIVTDISTLSLEEVREIIQATDLAFHVPTAGKIVTGYKVVSPAKIIWKEISLFVIFDRNEDKVRLEIRNGKQILESASNLLAALHADGKLSLSALCKSSDETINLELEAILNHQNPEMEARVQKIRQLVLESSTKTTGKKPNKTLAGTALTLLPGQINQVLSEVLNSAKRQVIIYSPSITQSLREEKILTLLAELANRGVKILIGYGISQLLEDAERPIPPELETKIRAIKTSDGLPSVHLCWLGDSHVKEIIVDQEIYLCGSHNWLSYHGEHLPQGESVYQVTIPHEVQEANKFLTHRYQNHAQKLWENAVENHDEQLAIESLCVWDALGMEDIALTAIQQNNWLELLPVWLNLIVQGLKSKKVPDDSPSLTIALSMLSHISPDSIYIEPLRQGLCQVISAIANNNPDNAVNLLTEPIRHEFLRLNIAPEGDLLESQETEL